MRWWDGRVRWRGGLVMANALCLAFVAEGALRWGALAAGVGAGLLLLRSLRFRPPPGTLEIARIPGREGAMYLGRGYEWTVEDSEDALEGVEAPPREADLFLPDDVLAGHVLALGTTGSGKTRLLELLILQAIERGDAVVVVDPKGDRRLLGRVRAAAGGRFRLFSLPHPERSVRYNPIGRYHDVREVADRVAALLPSTGEALPFRNFGWEVIYTVARAIEGRHPMTLQNLKRFAIDKPIRPLSDRPREHYLKLVSALPPLLSKLGADLLSPVKGGLSWEEVDRGREVVYFSLGSLLAGESSSAVAKMAILDLQSYVGARYAHAKGEGPIWLFVDELGDVVTQELVGVMNKSRGAGFRIVAAAQTAPDLEAALGSRARALQVFGNANTWLQFRAQNGEDAELFSAMAGKRLLRMRSEGASYEPALLGSGLEAVDDFRARFGETLEWREQPIVPPWAAARLPTFHFFGRAGARVFRGRIPLLA